MDEENKKKNPSFPEWKMWILLSIAISQLLTAVQIRQANQSLWNAVIQQERDMTRLAENLSDHLKRDILYSLLNEHSADRK